MLPWLALGEVWQLDRDEGAGTHIARAVELITRVYRGAPSGCWYCRYGPSVSTRELLVEEGGFLYDSTRMPTTCPITSEVSGRQHARSTTTRGSITTSASLPGAGYGSPR